MDPVAIIAALEAAMHEPQPPTTPPTDLDITAPTRTLAWTDETDTVVEWPAYTVEEVPMLERFLPYPVDVYPAGGGKGWGLAGRVPANGLYEHLPLNNAPRAAQHWDETVARFVPHTVVWNGVATGGVLHPEETPDGIARRIYDGTLMGEWPLNPPRELKPRDPEKARLAAEEAE